MLQIKALEAKDMCWGMMSDGHGRRCLSGHVATFQWILQSPMYKRLREYIIENHGGDGSHSCITGFNDTHTLQECADVWNRCFEKEIQHAAN